MAFLSWSFSTKVPNLNNMLTLITKSTCCTHHYTYHDSRLASQSNMIISKNISTSSMAAYHDIFHQHHLICWWRSALTSGGVAHIWIFYLIILHCSWSWSKWVDLEIIHLLRLYVLWILQHNDFHSSAWEPRNLAICSPPEANIEQNSFFLVFL